MPKHYYTYLFFLLVLFSTFSVSATHNRAGEITYRQINQLTFEVTVTTYTKVSGPSINADRDSVEVNWGDGNIEFVARVNGNPGGQNGIPQGEMIADDVKMNKYVANHTYPGPLPFYVISMTDPNRNGGIHNVNNGNSVNILFYLEDTLRIFDPTFVGYNSSPILLNPPIDYANINDTFIHNPAAYDPDGDSLSFELVPSKASAAFDVPLYRYPDEVTPDPNNIFTIDQLTGQITWATPKAPVGEYNAAILIREFRNGIQLGTVLRDMQINVSDQLNDPPKIKDLNDTCIIATNNLSISVEASDPNPGQTVTLSAYGGPLQLQTNPATFNSTPAVGTATGFFQWQTNCDHIRRQFYQVVFKAEDNYRAPGNQLIPLVDIETWLIRVIAPPPENLVAEPIGNTVELEWDDPYLCGENATDNFVGFSVWRRLGSNPFNPDTCETGLAGRGYTKIAEFLKDFNYIDSNVQKGQQYCYRILAEFGERTPFGLFYNRVESIPSNEACSELKRDVPLLTNVSVEATDENNGEIFVAWVKPIPDLANLDTNQFPGPYEFRLLRGDGANAPNQQVASFTSPTFGSLNDTSFLDQNLNTVAQGYNYQIDFYANNGELVGSSEPATSIFLELFASDRQMELLWDEQVPWINNAYEVSRLNPISGSFEPLDTVFEQSYLDENLINDSLYCYQVLGIGAYTGADLPSPLFNYSQENCARPLDTIPPCAPVLEVKNNCRELNEGESCEVQNIIFVNELSWNLPCDETVEEFSIYYSSPFEDSYTLIDRVGGLDSTYKHELGSGSVAGCYVVTATDSADNESELSNEFCVDNCPCYKLPNVFTPNGDGDNDFFTPFLPYRFIDRIDMQIFNRLGGLVFETENPDILWDGTNLGGKEMPEGVYYYTCTVYEVRVEGIVQSGDVLSGYIHLIRNK